MAGTIVCSRCGVANAAGDQFCGSCGAFLEWEGQAPPIQADAPVAEPDPLAAEPVEAAPVDVLPPQPPPAEAAPAPPPPPVQAGFTVCPHCGSGNPPGRTFCHQCGKLLARPEPEAAAAAGGRAKERRSGGLPGWLPLVIGAGLIVGVIAVVLAIVL